MLPLCAPTFPSRGAVPCQAASHPHEFVASRTPLPFFTGSPLPFPCPLHGTSTSNPPHVDLWQVASRPSAMGRDTTCPSSSSWPLLPLPCPLHDTSIAIPSFFGAPPMTRRRAVQQATTPLPCILPDSPHRFAVGQLAAGDGLLASPLLHRLCPTSCPPSTQRCRAPSQLLIRCW
jgi:hypothetical protein